MTPPEVIHSADTVRLPVVVDEDHSAWRAMCLWLAERDNGAMTNGCGQRLLLWDGEYEGECERSTDHDGPHYDGIHTWRFGVDGDIDRPEDLEQFDGTNAP